MNTIPPKPLQQSEHEHPPIQLKGVRAHPLCPRFLQPRQIEGDVLLIELRADEGLDGAFRGGGGTGEAVAAGGATDGALRWME